MVGAKIHYFYNAVLTCMNALLTCQYNMLQQYSQVKVNMKVKVKIMIFDATILLLLSLPLEIGYSSEARSD